MRTYNEIDQLPTHPPVLLPTRFYLRRETPCAVESRHSEEEPEAGESSVDLEPEELLQHEPEGDGDEQQGCQVGDGDEGVEGMGMNMWRCV